jgi:thioester reductase-like protein
MQVYVLDKHLLPVPDSVPGEIHLGGVGVALGYLNRPDLTAERFIPNPFAKVSGVGYQVSEDKAPDTRHPAPDTRLYKTGDLARYRSDGTLEFLGRIDTQVKIRGFRIELGEIEAVLAQHPALHEVVVAVCEGASSASGAVDKRLVAYVVPQAEERQAASGDSALLPETSVAVAELRDFLKARLPAYMMPSAFVTLQALPLTENGKVNYRALPTPDSGRSELDTTFVAPRTPTEELLATIWAELLGKDQVGIHDNFFELGGHSLLATRLILRLRDALQVDLPLRYLFDTLTVAGLAEAIVTLQRTTPSVNDAEETLIAYLHREATLDPTIMPEIVSGVPTVVPSSILLTGATGFLGAFLLYELLQQTRTTIHCLVRAADSKEGRRKLQHHLEDYNLWEARFGQRLIPIIGDLSLPQLGLSTEQFHTLANTVEAIYHNGAQVNFLYPYERLKAINVLGTQEVLRLACIGTVKPVHYISTLSVFPSYGCSTPKEINEQDEPEQCEGLYSGYAQSKWVAEKLVRIARDRGVPVCIYRPATITGDSKTGRSHPDDYTSRLIKGCIQLGSARDYDRKMYFTPVDFVSKAIVYLSRQPESCGKAFHLINPQPMLWSELIRWTQAYGYPLEVCSFDDWRMQLSEAARDSQENGLYAFLPMFFDEQVAEMERANWFRFLEFTCAGTLAVLAAGGISCPPLDDALLQTYFAYFIHSGFLAAPALKDEGYRVSADAPPTAVGQSESERRRWSLSMVRPAFG